MHALEAVGRATRVAGAEVEIWRFAKSDAATAKRLCDLGALGVGGFASWGDDDDGVWARRRVARATAEETRGLAWREALAIVRVVARALAACEKASISPGRVHPASICVAPDVWLIADALVRAIVGAEAPVEATPVGRWTPPEQARGARWDAGANRYALGLVAYWLLAGEHPFAGAGWRQALARQAIGAPPFADEVAARIRPGVQSFVLAMIDPDARVRPPDAETLARRCDELLEEHAAVRSSVVARPRTRETQRAPRRRATRATGGIARAGVIAAGLAALAGAALAGAEPSGGARPTVRPARSLDDATPASCAHCHAREVSEWSRSVMAHAARSPLFGSLESVVEEQVGRDATCPNGAGVLRATGSDVCRSDASGVTTTGSGGERWCIHCHAPADTLRPSVPPWAARRSSEARAPLLDLLAPQALDGITCAVCHEAIGPVQSHARASATGAYEGNATWASSVTGAVFAFRPEDRHGLTGIGNSGYAVDELSFLARGGSPHRAPTDAARSYARSSEACGACHDVRLFGSDVVGAPERGEHFKRLRNAYSEWRAWADDEARKGRTAATCQDCHMSLYPGICASGGGGGSGCAPGTHFESRAPGDLPIARVAPSSERETQVRVHGFASVDVPMARDLPDAFADDTTRDAFDLPLGIRARRELLLSRALKLTVEPPRRRGATLEVPVVLENVGAGHRVPAGFSQEREIWVELTVTDGAGGVVYGVGHLDAPDQDLRDKVFLRVNVDDGSTDPRGRPLGVFGADVADGADVPRWSPPPGTGATSFHGRGLINLQNGFLRCVRCIGVIDARGVCRAGEVQGATRADRFDDGDYDVDTGECRSNLTGSRALFETYFPVGALDAERGIAKAPDAIVDTRSAPPGVPLSYLYELPVAGSQGPFHVEARLLFRAFPPYLVRAFAAYEAQMDARGARPSGPQVDLAMLRRLDVVELARVEAEGR